MGSHHVDQDGLDLLTLGDPLTLASQSTGITDVSYVPGLLFPFIVICTSGVAVFSIFELAFTWGRLSPIGEFMVLVG